MGRVSNKKPFELTYQQAIAFTLMQQYLAQPAGNPLETMRQIVAIQAQYSAGIPLALWARYPSLPQDWVDRALFETKVLVKTWCLRGTIHVLASADLALMVQAIGQQQASEYEYFMQTRRGVGRQTIQELHAAVLRALSQHPLNRSELHRTVPQLTSIEGASWGLDVKGLAFTGELVMADSDNNETRFARRSAWLPELVWELPLEETAQQELLWRYLAAYGPATMQDFAHWSGLKMKTVKTIFERCASDLIRINIAGQHGEYYLRCQDELLVRAAMEAPPAVCLLPKFDPLLMGYSDKTRFIRDEDLSQVYRPAAQVEAVVLLQGHAVGTWRASLHGSQLTLSIAPFRRLDKREQTLIESKAEQLAAFLGGKKLNMLFHPEL